MATFNVTNLAELQAAITAANSNGADDTISLAAGTYRLVSTLIIGEAGHSITLDGDANNDGVADALITGDVNNDDTTVGATDITDIFATAATELDDNVRISSTGTADITLEGLVLTGGVALSGSGGAVNTAASLTLINSTVSGNSAAAAGGGIVCGTLTLTNSTVSGNSAASIGGGIFADTANLTNSTVSGNSAGLGGGGIRASTANLTNSTVSGNSAEGVLAVTANLTNSIVLGNGAGEVDATTLNRTGGNIVGTNVFQGDTDVGDTTATDVFAATVDIGGGVLAGVLADNGGPVQTIALKLDFSNPALDASNASAPATDVAGNARFDLPGVTNTNGSAADLGALEATETPSLVVTTLADVVNEFDGFTSLREAIAYANTQGGADTITFDAGLNGTIRLDGGDGAGGTVGGTLSITEAVTIDGDGRILITGDVSNDDTTVGATDITDIFATAATELDDNVRIINASADLTLDGLTLTGGVAVGFSSGGGILATTVNLTDSTVSGNSAGAFGGGIAATTANLTNSTVSGNNSLSGSGGGINAGTATLTNSTVSGNEAGGSGGGIVANIANLINSTVSGNSAAFSGGGIAATTANLTNSIVLGNDASGNDDVLGARILTGGNIVGDTFTINGGSPQTGITLADVFASVGANPHTGVQSGVLADNGGPVQTIALKAFVTNPALDASINTAPATDARGEARVDQSDVANANGSAADLGAFEVNTPLGFTIVGTRKADTINATHTAKGQHLPGEGGDVILGGSGNDRIAALGGDDTIIGGKGADRMRGGDGEDVFQFNSLAELRTIQTVTEVVHVGRGTHSVISQKVLWDHITDFTSGDDRLDFANMDADKTTGGKQDFTLIGSSQFSGNAGELRFVNKASGAVVSGDTNGDGKADFKLLLDHATVAADDFILLHV